MRRGAASRRAGAAARGIFAAVGAALLLAAVGRAEEPPRALAVPETGAYTGAYIDFGDTEDHVTLPAIEAFEKLVGKRQAIVASSSYWGRNSFPAANLKLISDHGAVPLVYWSPWAPPYNQGEFHKPDAFTLKHIIAGDCDAYLDRWAAGAREYGQPFLVSFGNEANSDWFPWTGQVNGADKKNKEGAFTGPEMYKQAYRHVVDRVRAAGAKNIQWVFHANGHSIPDQPWNAMAQYYPGADYVDWLGLSCYGQITPGKESWDEWPEVMDEAYKTICALDPGKPVMLAEWGVGEYDDPDSKADFFDDAWTAFKAGKYPRVKAAVIWHERWQNSDESYSNLRVNSSESALKFYREGMADPFWLDRPQWR